MSTNTTRIFAATIIALAIAVTAHAYPSVVVNTPYNNAPEPKTTVLYNPYSGNVYVHGATYDVDDEYRDAYTKGYYDGKYRRNPNYCQYDWFERCSSFDPDRAYDYYYSRCEKYDPGDDEWYERDCDLYFGRYRPGSYGGAYDHYDYDYPHDRYYSDNYYNDRYYSNYYTSGYPRLYVHYINDYAYENSGYYGGYNWWWR